MYSGLQYLRKGNKRQTIGLTYGLQYEEVNSKAEIHITILICVVNNILKVTTVYTGGSNFELYLASVATTIFPLVARIRSPSPLPRENITHHSRRHIAVRDKEQRAENPFNLLVLHPIIPLGPTEPWRQMRKRGGTD